MKSKKRQLAAAVGLTVCIAALASLAADSAPTTKPAEKRTRTRRVATLPKLSAEAEAISAATYASAMDAVRKRIVTPETATLRRVRRTPMPEETQAFCDALAEHHAVPTTPRQVLLTRLLGLRNTQVV